MKAAVWHGKQDVRIQEVPDPPPPAAGQIQVEVAWCGICGTDLHEYFAGPLYIPLTAAHPLTRIQAPVVIGHEISGRVLAVGEGVKDFRPGDRVAACPIIGCQTCRWCRSGSMAQCEKVAFVGTSWHGGGFAEVLNLNRYQCFHLPDSISDESGALVEPFSATARAVVRGAVQASDNVAVVGAGPIGLLTVLAARIQGARRVVAVEPSACRREAALQGGADDVIDPARDDPVQRAQAITEGEGFDVVIECAGREATGLLAARLVRTRGRVVVMGVFDKPAPIDLTDLVFREKTVIGSMSGYGLYDESIRMMCDSRFKADRLITGGIRLDDLVEKGYRPLVEETDKHVKIIVSPR